MDDFVLSNLQESRNEWCSRLVSILCPLVIEGVHSIFNEAWKMCIDQNEPAKYLMTFQNLLARIPKWNSLIIEEERKRMIERSGCNYMEDLITCVHIIQLKVITCIRVGSRQKKIDISIPKLDHFIHKLYTHAARKIFTNVYLFEKNISQLQVQKNNRELEMIVQESIMITIRESIPTEDIIRAYMDESVEHEEEVTIEQLDEPVLHKPEDIQDDSKIDSKIDSKTDSKTDSKIDSEPRPTVPSIQNTHDEPVTTRLSFNDYDSVLDLGTDKSSEVSAPKTIERLEEISVANALQRKLDEEAEDDGDDNDRIKISSDTADLAINDLDDIPMMDIETLDFDSL